jgi:hypothetical protein
MKRLNNKVLIITLLVLAAAFVLTRVLRSPGRERNLDAGLLKVDTTGITEIRLYPASGQRKEIKLLRDGKKWDVEQETLRGSAERNAVNSLLSTLASLKPERLVSRKKEKWDHYGTDDTTGTRVDVFHNSDALASLVIGKESGGLTYVRPSEEEAVYAAVGYVSAVVDKNFTHWRDKSFLRLDKEQVTRITFNYPADSGFVAEKKGDVWMIDNERADSVAIENYLNNLRSKDLSAFADGFAPTANPDVTVTIESKAMPEAVIKAWRESFYKWTLTSSFQQGVYFSDEGPVAVRELFVGKKKLLEKQNRVY